MMIYTLYIVLVFIFKPNVNDIAGIYYTKANQRNPVHQGKMRKFIKRIKVQYPSLCTNCLDLSSIRIHLAFVPRVSVSVSFNLQPASQNNLQPVLPPPKHKLIPVHPTLTAPIPPQLHRSPQVLRNPPIPARLPDRAVHGLSAIPALLGHDIREVRRAEGSLAGVMMRGREEEGGG